MDYSKYKLVKATLPRYFRIKEVLADRHSKADLAIGVKTPDRYYIQCKDGLFGLWETIGEFDPEGIAVYLYSEYCKEYKGLFTGLLFGSVPVKEGCPSHVVAYFDNLSRNPVARATMSTLFRRTSPSING